MESLLQVKNVVKVYGKGVNTFKALEDMPLPFLWITLASDRTI